MSDGCKQFISDVSKKYTKYANKVDDSYNIVVTVNDLKHLMISYKIIKDYYDGYRKSDASRDIMINRALIKIDELIASS